MLKMQAAASMHTAKDKQSLQREELQAKSFHSSSDKVNVKAQVRGQPLTLPVPRPGSLHDFFFWSPTSSRPDMLVLKRQVVFDACWRRLEEKHKNVRPLPCESAHACPAGVRFVQEHVLTWFAGSAGNTVSKGNCVAEWRARLGAPRSSQHERLPT